MLHTLTEYIMVKEIFLILFTNSSFSLPLLLQQGISVLIHVFGTACMIKLLNREQDTGNNENNQVMTEDGLTRPMFLI